MLDQHSVTLINERLGGDPFVIKIVLFGSQARGTADVRSDVDLIVIMKEFNDRYKTARQIRKKLAGLPYGFDIIVMTADEYELDKEIPGTVSRYAFQEGVVLYAA